VGFSGSKSRWTKKLITRMMYKNSVKVQMKRAVPCGGQSRWGAKRGVEKDKKTGGGGVAGLGKVATTSRHNQ